MVVNVNKMALSTLLKPIYLWKIESSSRAAHGGDKSFSPSVRQDLVGNKNQTAKHGKKCGNGYQAWQSKPTGWMKWTNGYVQNKSKYRCGAPVEVRSV